MWRTILFCIAVFSLIIACEPEPDPPAPIATMNVVDVPEFLQCEYDSMYLYRVRIENLDDVEFVMCTITRPDGTGGLSIELYDDGNASMRNGPDFASETSLDAVPRNGTFTRGIQANLFCIEGEGVYQFHFVTMGGSQTLEIPNLDVEVRSLDDCVFEDVVAVGMLPACFAERTISLTVTPEIGVEIDSVRTQLFSGDTLWWSKLMTHGTGQSWSYLLAPSLFGCTPSASNYMVRCEAFTRFGLNCTMDEHNISFVNIIPVLSNPELPDTLYRPVSASDSNIYQMFVNYNDCELNGWSQRETVWFQVRREDVQDWQSDSDFYLRNDGVPPDLLSGDNVASSYLVTKNNGLLDNLYYFRYFAIDCASGDTSNFLLDSTRIIQEVSEGGPFVATPTDDLGISSFK